MKNIFSGLDDLIQMQLQLDIEAARMQAQSQAYDGTRKAIRSIAKNCDLFVDQFNDLSLKFSANISKLNKSADKQITKEAWDNVVGTEFDLICKNINTITSWLPSAKAEVESAQTLEIADMKYKSVVVHIQNWFRQWEPRIDSLQVTYADEIARLQHPDAEDEQKQPPAQQLPLQQQLEDALKQVQDLMEALDDRDQVIDGLRGENGDLRDQLTVKDGTITNLQIRLLDKTDEASDNHVKFLEEHHKVDLVKVKLGHFIDDHQGIDGQEDLVEMLGDLG